MLDFKESQVIAFANYLLDISKGLVLGVIGAVIINNNINIYAISLAVVVSLLALLNGLYLLSKT